MRSATLLLLALPTCCHALSQQMKKVPTKRQEDVAAPTDPGCYDTDENDNIVSVDDADCTCHPSCLTCGFYDEPTDSDDCASCADGSDVAKQYEDGTGYCGAPTPKSPGCWDDDRDDAPIASCECHASCSVCGYYDEPTEDDDCVACADGSEVSAVYDDGTGTCSPTPSVLSAGCYEEPADDAGGVPTPTEGCACYHACKACGFSDDPTGEDDCLSCADGSPVNEMYGDGRGTCDHMSGGIMLVPPPTGKAKGAAATRLKSAAAKKAIKARRKNLLPASIKLQKLQHRRTVRKLKIAGGVVLSGVLVAAAAVAVLRRRQAPPQVVPEYGAM